jgi:hypothetical protein
MQRDSVTSTMINSVGYDPDTKVLEIEFNNGEVYTYHNIEQGEYDSLMNASSIGKYFSANIKGRHSTSKL